MEAILHRWQAERRVARLWAGDASLWTGGDEARWLGWLRLLDETPAPPFAYSRLSEEVRAAGFRHALLMGMGGSSLCPEVLRSTFGRVPGSPDLSVLDSTDPAQIASARDRIDPARTLFIVSSKSGTTLESRTLMDFFYGWMSERVGASDAGRQWIAITDPGTKLESMAADRGFRAVFAGRPDVGGRFSALSGFGMVPAAIMGVDVEALWARSGAMARATAGDVDAPRNPAVALGVVLGAAAEAGRDKVTLVTSPPLAAMGAWLEQLLAESTGKDGRGLIPVDGEPLDPPEFYGADRVFVYTRSSWDPADAQDRAVAALEEAGHPVVRIDVGDAYDIGQEFFRWELAVAAAGSYMGLNPFDQPDVDASKAATRALMDGYETSGALPGGPSLCRTPGLELFGDARGPWGDAGRGAGLTDFLRAHLRRIDPGDYFAILAYVESRPEIRDVIEDIRRCVGRGKKVATTVGFGPRFLHSTGQLHKGGPNTGVFLQITCDDVRDIPAPGRGYSFGVIKAAQAAGDSAVLAERKRRFLRVHLGSDTTAGLDHLRDAIRQALVL